MSLALSDTPKTCFVATKFNYHNTRTKPTNRMGETANNQPNNNRFTALESQSVTCLATDACLTADPGVASSIPARHHTFVEIDHEIISTVILLPSTDLFKKGCCQLQSKVCAQITG